MKCPACENTTESYTENCMACHGTGDVCCIRINRGPLTRQGYEDDDVLIIQTAYGWNSPTPGRYFKDRQFTFEMLSCVTAWVVLPNGE